MNDLRGKLALLYRTHTLRDISKQMGMSHEWVRNNLPVEIIRHRKKNIIRKEKIIDFYKKTGSIASTCYEFNITRGWVTKILNSNGITKSKRSELRGNYGCSEIKQVQRCRARG